MFLCLWLFHVSGFLCALTPAPVCVPVGFDDCTGRKSFWFNTEDKRFRVESDGTVKVKRQVALHSEHKDFSIHVWDSLGRKMTVTARVVLQAREHHGHGHQYPHGHGHQDTHGHGHQ